MKDNLKQLLRNTIESKGASLVGGLTGGAILLTQLGVLLDDDPATQADTVTLIAAGVCVALGLFLRAKK